MDDIEEYIKEWIKLGYTDEQSDELARISILGCVGDIEVDDKVFPFFLGDEGISTVWAPQLHGREAAFAGRKPRGTDLAEQLSFGAVIPVKKWFRGITAWAGAVIGNVTLRAPADRADLLAVAFFDIGDEFFVSPVLPEVGDQRKFINFELLVFGGVGIIKRPLLKREVSADKI